MCHFAVETMTKTFITSIHKLFQLKVCEQRDQTVGGRLFDSKNYNLKHFFSASS